MMNHLFLSILRPDDVKTCRGVVTLEQSGAWPRMQHLHIFTLPCASHLCNLLPVRVIQV